MLLVLLLVLLTCFADINIDAIYATTCVDADYVALAYVVADLCVVGAAFAFADGHVLILGAESF